MHLLAAGVLVGALLPAAPRAAPDDGDTQAQMRRASALEVAGRWAQAREAWERVIDTCPASEEQRLHAVRRLHYLNTRVPPQTDPSQANVWHVYAALFRTLDFTWKNKQGEETHVHIECTNQELDLLKEGLRSFGDLVFEYSRGALRLELVVDVIDEPLTRLSGEESFWIGPWDVKEHIGERCAPGRFDSVFAYAKLSDGGQQKVPAAMFGGTYGGDLGPGGAGWTGIMWYPGWMKGDGEVELHEWLHQVDWAFAHRLGYPDAIVPTSDGGRKVGDEGGDPDWRRRPLEVSWLRFYRHLMSEHITSRMWREARCRLWEGTDHNRGWLVVGPFEYEKGDRRALERHYPRDRVPSGQVHHAQDDFVDLDRLLGPTDYAVAYAIGGIASERPQTVRLCLGYDDAIIASVNGERVYTFDGASAARRDEAIVKISLREGYNTVLLKVLEIEGGWGFYARLGGLDGRGVTGARWVAPEELPEDARLALRE